MHIGITEIKSNTESVLVYPNPSNGQYTIEFPKVYDTNLSYTIENVLSQKLKSGDLDLANKNYFSLNISDYPNGVYFLSFASKGMVVRLKIIKE